jgi:hypothetical protein
MSQPQTAGDSIVKHLILLYGMNLLPNGLLVATTSLDCSFYDDLPLSLDSCLILMWQLYPKKCEVLLYASIYRYLYASLSLALAMKTDGKTLFLLPFLYFFWRKRDRVRKMRVWKWNQDMRMHGNEQIRMESRKIKLE